MSVQPLAALWPPPACFDWRLPGKPLLLQMLQCKEAKGSKKMSVLLVSLLLLQLLQ